MSRSLSPRPHTLAGTRNGTCSALPSSAFPVASLAFLLPPFVYRSLIRRLEYPYEAWISVGRVCMLRGCASVSERTSARARSSERSRVGERKSQRAGNFTFALPVNFLFFAQRMSTHTCKHAHAHAKHARRGHRRHSTPDHHNSERSKEREGRACACALPRTCPSARSSSRCPQCGIV